MTPERLAEIERYAENYVEPTYATVDELIDEVKRLRAALEGAKIGHGAPIGSGVCAAIFALGRPCYCGADAHNAKIEKALRGE